ncbi:MAG TPA: hypothetical protein VND93_08275 [Myxococcales bacterium]|jgi:hypothetical protein|nr:hypothetical protein [Myxococcales bacterium]
MDPTQSTPERGRKLPHRDASRPEEQDAPLVEDAPVIRPAVGPSSTPGLDSGKVIKPQVSERDFPGVHVH